MTVSERIIDELNKDAKAKQMLTMFENAAEKAGMCGEEYFEARKTMLMLIISKRKDLMGLMANEMWEEVNGVKGA